MKKIKAGNSFYLKIGLANENNNKWCCPICEREVTQSKWTSKVTDAPKRFKSINTNYHNHTYYAILHRILGIDTFRICAPCKTSLSSHVKEIKSKANIIRSGNTIDKNQIINDEAEKWILKRYNTLLSKKPTYK